MTSGLATLASLCDGIEDLTIVQGGHLTVDSIYYDSRAVVPGSLFVALRGGYHDGHDYLGVARTNGATACLIDRPPADVDLDGYDGVVVAANSRKALAGLARAYYGDPSRDLRLIGVTGTDGKTTTGFMIDFLLQHAGLQTGSIGTVAITIAGRPPRSPGRQTTPESLDTQRLLAEMRDAGVEVAVLETSSHGLATHRVDGCSFDIGVLTNITHEHLDFHGTLDAYREAKAKLFRHVADARLRGGLGIAILNRDDPGARSIRPAVAGLTVIEYSATCPGDCQISAGNIRATSDGFRFELRIGDDVYPVSLPLVGNWNISNALAATAVCHALGVSGAVIADGLGTTPAPPGRMEPVVGGQPFAVFVDYAHTAPALRQVLEAVREHGNGRVLLVFGSAGERDIEKRAAMGAVAAELADYFVVTSEDPRFEDPDAIIAEIVSGAVRAGAVEHVDFDRLEDRRLAIERVLEKAGPDDAVILAGKGHERSMIYESEHRPWDESGIALDILRTLGYSEAA